jgi:hypothetical protein
MFFFKSFILIDSARGPCDTLGRTLRPFTLRGIVLRVHDGLSAEWLGHRAVADKPLIFYLDRIVHSFPVLISCYVYTVE